MGSQVTGQERELNLAWNLQVKKNMRKPWETNARSSKPKKKPCKNGSWQTKSCQTSDGRAYLPGQNAFKKNMRYELSLSLFVLFQEHDTICIRYNNASAF